MKILVVFTGGTISCSSDNGVLHTDKLNSYLLLDMYAERDRGVEFTAVQPYAILSENLCGENLNALYECIEHYNLADYDGVIVTHGTDTLQYTSAFLGYAFSNSDTPIVLVSANFPLADSRSNGFDNFCGAVDFIRSGGGRGVFAAYKNKGENVNIHRGTRLVGHMPYSDDLHSVADCCFGEIVDGEFVKNLAYSEQADEMSFDEILFDKMAVYKVSPYVDMVYPRLDKDVKAILLEGYHSGTLATAGERLEKFCKSTEILNIPVFLTGACKGFEYESKLAFDRLKINVLPMASPIAMYVKLRLLKGYEIGNIYKNAGGDFAE